MSSIKPSNCLSFGTTNPSLPIYKFLFASDTWGMIDDLLIYSDTLTSQEVLRIYNAGKRSHK